MRALKLPCLVIGLLGCATSLEAQNAKRCADTPIDSTNPSAPVYRDCHVEHQARPLRNSSGGAGPGFTPPSNGPSCYRATFEFIVDTTGKPEMGSVRRVSASDQSYGSAMEGTIGSLMFEPARLNGTAVRQLVKFEPRMALRVTSAMVSGGGSPVPSQVGAARRPNC